MDGPLHLGVRGSADARLAALSPASSIAWLCLSVIALSVVCGCSRGDGPAVDPNVAERAGSPAAVDGRAPADSAAVGGSAAVELPPAVESYPPVAWTVPAGGLPASPPVADVIDIGGAQPESPFTAEQRVYLFAGCRDRYLMPELFFDESAPGGGKFGERMLLGRFDPATGQPTGQPLSLGPEYAGDFGLNSFQGKSADVAPNGTVAIQYSGNAPGAYAKIAIVAPTGEAPRLLDQVHEHHTWFGWSADNRLLVLHEGRLHLWDVTASAPVFGGRKTRFADRAVAARNWVVAAVDNRYLEVFDAATGEVRGRFGPEGQWKHAAISPDGGRLAAVRYAGPPREPSSSPPQDRYDIHVWDMTNGTPIAQIIPTWLSYGPPISWAGPNHVYHDNRVFDLDSRMAIVMLTLPEFPVQNIRQESKPTTAIASPDGRQWWTGNCGQAFAAAIPLQPPGGELAFDQKTVVKLEVVGPDAARNQQVEDAISTSLTSAGYTLGDSPWKLRVSTKSVESGFELFDNQRKFTVPGVQAEVQIVAPDGAALGTISIAGEFFDEHSAYLVRTERNNPLEPLTTLYKYDFRGRDPREAILDECWDKTLKSLRSIKHLPTVWNVNGKYQSLPVPVTLSPPPGVPRQRQGG